MNGQIEYLGRNCVTGHLETKLIMSAMRKWRIFYAQKNTREAKKQAQASPISLSIIKHDIKKGPKCNTYYAHRKKRAWLL